MEQLQLIQAPYMRECNILGDWAHHADKAIKQLAATGRPFTADDVRALIPDGLTPAHNNAWGGLFSAWRTSRTITPIGYRQSAHGPRHGGYSASGKEHATTSPQTSSDPMNH